MATIAEKSYFAKTGELARAWHSIDADGVVLGRLAVKVATVLMGKHRPTYTPHVDTGEFVVVTNAEKMKITGRKLEQKLYDHYTGYPGGRKVIPLSVMMAKRPEQVIELAVRRMLPKSKLGRQMLKKLKVYRGSDHLHQAQMPQPLDI